MISLIHVILSDMLPSYIVLIVQLIDQYMMAQLKFLHAVILHTQYSISVSWQKASLCCLAKNLSLERREIVLDSLASRESDCIEHYGHKSIIPCKQEPTNLLAHQNTKPQNSICIQYSAYVISLLVRNQPCYREARNNTLICLASHMEKL